MLIEKKSDIGSQLRIQRKKNGLSQAELAEKAGLSDRTYADIERGNTNMHVDTLLKICKVLKITPNDILVMPKNVDNSTIDEISNEIKQLEPAKQNAAIEIMSAFMRCH